MSHSTSDDIFNSANSAYKDVQKRFKQVNQNVTFKYLLHLGSGITKRKLQVHQKHAITRFSIMRIRL